MYNFLYDFRFPSYRAKNHLRVAENAIRKHDTGFMHKGFMHKGFIVEDFERTKVVMYNFSVPLPVLELWPKNHFRVVDLLFKDY